MLVERGIKDRYLTLSVATSSTESGTDKVEIIEATLPQRLRIRRLSGSVWLPIGSHDNDPGENGQAIGCIVVAVVPQGLTPASILPAGFSWDLWEPASDVLYSRVIVVVDDWDNKAGPSAVNWEWEGDGTIFDLKVGDRVFLIYKEIGSPTISVCRVMLDVEILR